ncbi:ankyrin repeat-containing domain protein [Coprinopsis sp. MPI-PUGE-AT-0042]|nr:ankyrin repeat-containing domain protein [Coprinopsis sp. MPI-PUGE-AT-0042]
MTITEKALESDLHLVIEAKDDIRITAAYNQGADLIAGALQLSKEAIGVVFWYAIGHAHDQIVQFHAARSDQPVNTQGPNRRTALMHASRKGDEQLVRLLLQNPLIEVNLQDAKGRTALLAAANRGHEKIVKVLLERDDIQPNTTDEYGGPEVSGQFSDFVLARAPAEWLMPGGLAVYL